ncbi:MAG: HD-GYP domain-containing protein [Bacillota bacterium]|nr:HD-GYP domain-containing protein [Bacillota bacterium]
MRTESRKKTVLLFIISLAAILAIFVAGVIRTRMYNQTKHRMTSTGEELFTPSIDKSKPVSVNAVARGSTWSKAFDLNNEGLTDHNFQAYTYDFTVLNHTLDDVADFSFVITFSRDVFLSSAWNGALEIHQHTNGGEITATVPDLREFHPDDYPLKTFSVDGEPFIAMHAGDYLKYIPSSTMNAREVPIAPKEGTTPGIILYVRIGEDISDSILDLEYRFHRQLKSEPLVRIAAGCLAIWAVALIIFVITSAQIKKYKVLHERDNIIINESIETFTGFIDAKDPYTNGHSKRVAQYTRLLAEEMGFDGEELDRIYYIALLHDCGKIGVPDHILGKPGRLDLDEYEVIKTHTVCGGDILSRFKSLKDAGQGALYHHERYDGNGYPEGKAGEEIPLIARMICVADSFDAMNTDRVYRRRLTRQCIVDELESGKGRQFDPKIADIMLDLIQKGKVPTEK